MATAFFRSPSPEAGTPRGEQGVAQYETGAEPLVEAAVRPPVVVGKGVQVEVLREAVEACGDLG
jgi:hypothetical protein